MADVNKMLQDLNFEELARQYMSGPPSGAGAPRPMDAPDFGPSGQMGGQRPGGIPPGQQPQQPQRPQMPQGPQAPVSPGIPGQERGAANFNRPSPMRPPLGAKPPQDEFQMLQMQGGPRQATRPPLGGSQPELNPQLLDMILRGMQGIK